MAKAKAKKKPKPADVKIAWRDGAPNAPGLWIIRFMNGDQTLWKVELDNDGIGDGPYLRMSDNETSEPVAEYHDVPLASYGPCPCRSQEPEKEKLEQHIRDRLMQYREDIAMVLETLKGMPPDLEEAVKDPAVMKEIGQCVTDLVSVIDEHVELFQEARK